MSARDPMPPLGEQAMVAPVFLVPVLSAAVERQVPQNALQRVPIVGEGLALGLLAAPTWATRSASRCGVQPAPAHALAYEVYFACPVHFGCQSNALSTHEDWLGKRLPWANAMASHLSLQWLECEAERFNVTPTLGFSVARAIRRQLATMGLRFRQLLDEGRKARALDLMATGNRPISELAAATGFSDARARSRAFRRWTGWPPSQVRANPADIRPGPLSDPA